MATRTWSFLVSAILILGSFGVTPFQGVTASDLNCTTTFSNTSTMYPNQAEICTVFSNVVGANANYTAFFKLYVAEDVNWTIEGTHPLAGEYTNRSILVDAFSRIDATGAEKTTLLISIINIIGGGDEEWSVQELQVLGTCTSGMPFNFPSILSLRSDVIEV